MVTFDFMKTPKNEVPNTQPYKNPLQLGNPMQYGTSFQQAFPKQTQNTITIPENELSDNTIWDASQGKYVPNTTSSMQSAGNTPFGAPTTATPIPEAQVANTETQAVANTTPEYAVTGEGLNLLDTSAQSSNEQRFKRKLSFGNSNPGKTFDNSNPLCPRNSFRP